MKKLKKLLAVVMMIALMIPVTAFAAEGKSPSTVDISKATVSVSKGTYTGKKLEPKKIVVKLNGKTLKVGTDYTVKVKKCGTVGTHKNAVRIDGIGKYTGKVYANFTVLKANNTMKLATSGKNFGASKTKAKTCQITVKNAKGKVTYKSSSKKIKVNSKGKVTVAKGTKKGTYTITVKAAGNSSYKYIKKTFKVVVK